MSILARTWHFSFTVQGTCHEQPVRTVTMSIIFIEEIELQMVQSILHEITLRTRCPDTILKQQTRTKKNKTGSKRGFVIDDFTISKRRLAVT